MSHFAFKLIRFWPHASERGRPLYSMQCIRISEPGYSKWGNRGGEMEGADSRQASNALVVKSLNWNPIREPSADAIPRTLLAQ